MLFATIAILPPGLSRWPFHFMDSDTVFFGIFLAFPLAIVLFDLFAYKKVHRVTWLCSALIAILAFGSAPLAKTAIFHGLTQSIRR